MHGKNWWCLPRPWNSSPDKICEYDETTQACIEKECSDYDPNDCDSFHSTDYACVAKNGRCELIHCNDLSADNCYRVYSNSRVIEKSCLVKEDESGCELVKCEDLTAKCYRFYFGGGDTKCALNKEGTRCEPQKCSDLTENCEEYIPESYGTKCVFDSELNHCHIVEKECTDYTNKQCNDFHSSDLDESCIPDDNKCKLVKCSELSNSECSLFRNIETNKICHASSTSDKCEFLKCEDLSVNNCESIEFENDGYRCVISGNNCVFSSCFELTSNCESFIPLDPGHKCAADENGDCGIKDKECEEMDKDKCKYYNGEEGECIYSEEEDACVINYSNFSKKIELNVLVMLVLFLLL